MKGSRSKATGSSSKSIKSQKSRVTDNNVQEVKIYRGPYFKPDPIRQSVYQRSQKYRSKSNSRISKQKRDPLKKVSDIVNGLFKRHQQTKKKLQKMKQQRQQQLKKIYPFIPKSNRSNRYVVNGDVIRRNQLWLRQKKRKQLELQQQLTLKTMQNCTFSPEFSSKKTSQIYRKNKNIDISKNSRERSKSRNNDDSISPKFGLKKRDYTQTQYQLAKRDIVSRMMNNTSY